MATHSKHDLSSLQEACLAFEREWVVGVRPVLEEILQRYASLDHSVLFQNLLEIEIRYRLLNNEQPMFEEYAVRFPKEVLLIKQVLESLCGILDSTRRESGSSVDEPLACSTDSFQLSELKWIGRFEIIRELGSGGFGRVYLAFDRNVKREVAIKFLHAERHWDEEIRETFILEAQAQAKVEHPHVLPIYSVEQIPDSDAWYIVSKYVAGGTLKDRLDAERLGFEEIVRITIPLAQALHAMHMRGLYHRDVKPSNILFDAEGRVYLADFGLVVNERDQFRTRGQVAGSPSYMAPEQVQGKSHLLDGRADIWSLGVVLYEMLAGERPFQGVSLTELSEEILEREPRPLRLKTQDLPRELERIVLKCLRKNITDRYLTANDLAMDLEKFLDRSRSNRARLPVRDISGRDEGRFSSRSKIAAGWGLAGLLAMAVIAWKAGFLSPEEMEPGIKVPEGKLAEGLPEEERKLTLRELDVPFWDEGLWAIEEKQNMVRVFAREPSLRLLGESQNGKLTFRIDIPELEKDASVGLFFGFHITGAIQQQAEWQLVSLRRFTGREFAVLITSETQSKGHHGAHVLAEWRGILPPEELDLLVEAGPGGVEKVVVADQTMNQLMTEYTKNKEPGLETAGLFGLVCLQGGGAFANPELEGRVYEFDVPQKE